MGKKSRSKKVKNPDKLMKAKAEATKRRELSWAMGQVYWNKKTLKRIGVNSFVRRLNALNINDILTKERNLMSKLMSISEDI